MGKLIKDEFEIYDIERMHFKVCIIDKKVVIKGSFYSGFVKETDEDFFMLHCIGTDGEDKGNIIFRIEDVTEFSFDDREDRKTLMLYQWKSKKTINKTLKAIDFGRGIF